MAQHVMGNSAKEITRTLVGTVSGSSQTVDVSSYDGFENFTGDNFSIEVTAKSISASNGHDINDYVANNLSGNLAAASKSYVAETGILTVTTPLISVLSNLHLAYNNLDYNTSASEYVTVNVYLYHLT